MSHHTRGPWVTQGWVPTWAYIPVKDANHNLVCSLYPHEYRGYSRDDVEANALLIAASPEMLAALQAIAPFFDGDDRPECIQLRAAIAKATNTEGNPK